MLRTALRHALTPRTPRTSGRRSRARVAALGVVTALTAGLLTTYGTPATTANAADTVGMFTTTVKPKAQTTSSAPINVGVRFSTKVSGTVSAIQFYRSTAQKKAYTATLYDDRGAAMARAVFAARSTAGWQTATFSSPVKIRAGVTYTAAYFASDGRIAYSGGTFSTAYTKYGITVPKNGGVKRAATNALRPTTKVTANYAVDVDFTPTPVVRSMPGWPDESNTGVPAGQTLTAYTGSLTITANNTVIRNKVVTGTLNIRASNVQIVNTRINGSIRLDNPKSNSYSFTITDSEVHYPGLTGTGIMRGNFTAKRIEVTGGNRSVYCEYNCVIEDSLVHKQGADVGGDAHFSGIRMSQNGTFRHNTLICEAGRGPGTGCSAALTGYGDTMTVQNNLIERNLFIGNLGGGATMCAYGGSSPGKPYPNANRIRFVDNVFARGDSGKCGNLGSITAFDSRASGNVWSGNTWDDGRTIGSNG